MVRLLEKYKKEIVPQMMEKFRYKNIMQVPRLSKIVLNTGVGKAIENKNRIDAAVNDLSVISGQRPIVTKARQSVAGFKLRKGAEIGVKVTLRGKNMYIFLDKLINVAIPRLKDFRGLNKDSFDGNGNYSLGIPEQIIFPEISIDKVEFVQGLDITIVTTSKSNKEAFELLNLFGFPFAR